MKPSGNQVVLQVGERDAEQYGPHHGHPRGLEREAERQHRREPPERHEQLDRGILRRDASLTAGALAAQPQPAEDRHVLVPADLPFTEGAARRRRDNAQLRRPAGHAHIEERTEARTDHERGKVEGPELVERKRSEHRTPESGRVAAEHVQQDARSDRHVERFRHRGPWEWRPVGRRPPRRAARHRPPRSPRRWRLEAAACVRPHRGAPRPPPPPTAAARDGPASRPRRPTAAAAPDA